MRNVHITPQVGLTPTQGKHACHRSRRATTHIALRGIHFIVAVLVIAPPLSSGVGLQEAQAAPRRTVAQNAEAAPQIPLDDQDPLLWDAQIYASNMGVSVDEAIRRFQIQDIAGDLEAELSMRETKTFAGLWLEHTPEFRLVVQFTHDAKETIELYIPQELADITEVRTAGVSLEDLQDAQLRAISSVRDAGILVESGINVFENCVELYVADRARFDAALQSEKIRLPSNVRVITVKEMGKPEANIHGGLPLTECTSGFAARQPDGFTGITTAAHCQDSQSYSGTSLTFMSQLYAGSYDIQ
jgi:hypothetical protein